MINYFPIIFCLPAVAILCLVKDPLKTSVDYFSRGYAYFRMGSLRSALRDFNKAIELNPEYTDAYVKRAGVYLKMKKYQNAISDANKAIELDPDIPETYLTLGLSYEKTGELKKAKLYLQKAAQRGEKFAQQYLSDLRTKKKKKRLL